MESWVHVGTNKLVFCRGCNAPTPFLKNELIVLKGPDLCWSWDSASSQTGAVVKKDCS
jgi:hypothetical protein